MRSMELRRRSRTPREKRAANGSTAKLLPIQIYSADAKEMRRNEAWRGSPEKILSRSTFRVLWSWKQNNRRGKRNRLKRWSPDSHEARNCFHVQRARCRARGSTTNSYRHVVAMMVKAGFFFRDTSVREVSQLFAMFRRPDTASSLKGEDVRRENRPRRKCIAQPLETQRHLSAEDFSLL